MAEWLRRWTRNPMGFPRAGSNPAHDEFFPNFTLETCFTDSVEVAMNDKHEIASFIVSLFLRFKKFQIHTISVVVIFY